MFKQYSFRNVRIRLIILVGLLTGIGIMIVGSAEKSYMSKQLLGMALGVIAMLILTVTDYSLYMNFQWLIYIGTIVMLGLVLSPLGDVGKGAQRWIELGSFRFQPSELAKMLLILFFAKFFADHREKINNWKILFCSGVLVIIPLIMIKMQPDLSTTIVVALIFLGLLFCAGLSYKIIGGVLALTVPAAIVFISMIIPEDQKILDNYQWLRIMAWLNPSKYADKAYQQQNSIMAIGSGRFAGKGLNNNVVASVKNGNFIAEPQTDFIFAVCGEELGFIGCAAIIIILCLIILEILRIGRRAKDMTGTLICCGVASWIGFQSFINICVATGLMPNTGVPLPFVSYGLTSLVSLYIGIGIVMNVGLQPKKY